jgi:hypothetical protein
MASDANYGNYRRKKSNPTPRLSPKNKEHHGTDAIIIRTWYCSFAVTAAIAVQAHYNTKPDMVPFESLPAKIVALVALSTICEYCNK